MRLIDGRPFLKYKAAEGRDGVMLENPTENTWVFMPNAIFKGLMVTTEVGGTLYCAPTLSGTANFLPEMSEAQRQTNIVMDALINAQAKEIIINYVYKFDDIEALTMKDISDELIDELRLVTETLEGEDLIWRNCILSLVKFSYQDTKQKAEKAHYN